MAVKLQLVDLPPEMKELARHIRKIGSDDLNYSFGVVAECMLLKQYIMKQVSSELRLNINYLIFDLEATRRERDQLRERFQNE